MIPVVVSTAPGRSRWVADCIASIDREVTVVSSRGYLAGVVRWMHEHTDLPRWLLLQDSVVVRDQELFDLVEAIDAPLLLAPRPCMWLAVFDRAVLERVPIPTVTGKEECIRQEIAFMDAYVAAATVACGDVPVLFPELVDANARRQEWRHGRTNLVLENDHLRKYKGTWR